ncbi:hypothetical protein Pmani_030596 [Petrolisthes manimaculis]|uniref:Uncharacterized protein n=1 Tax=Petrolisthes manimaculis TaxID=1843537 RepID=A0AAE1NWC1_9EUCA|nr:hypothetical protein Pmani_030596 [Petrolisthes manimaculis]
MMKVFALTLLVVVAVNAIPQGEPEPAAEPEPAYAMASPTAEQLSMITQKKKNGDMLMMLTKGCMMKKFMMNCGCTSMDNCPIISTLMKCKMAEMKTCMIEKGFTKPTDMAPEGFPLKQNMIDAITDESCSTVLPPSKMMLMTIMSNSAPWHTMMVCMVSHGQYDNYKNCVLNEFEGYFPEMMQSS